jgi:hypothetical protein
MMRTFTKSPAEKTQCGTEMLRFWCDYNKNYIRLLLYVMDDGRVA